MDTEILCGDEYLQLKRMSCEIGHSYTFVHEVRCGGKMVSILPYRIKNGQFQFLLRREKIPCWSYQILLSSITGGIDKDYTAGQTAKKTLEEETGYVVEELMYLGTCNGIKSCDTRHYLYSVDLSNIDRPVEDEIEKFPRAEWVDVSMIYDCSDPLVSAIYVRLIDALFHGQ